MSARVSIRGLTWDHPRAHAGLDAETARFNAGQDRIHLGWEQHSLRGFEETPIVETAARYDLIILDHPFMGDAAASGCLVDLGMVPELSDALQARNFVGPSLESYRYEGGLRAMPIDAACQAAAWRPDLIDRPPETLDALRALMQTSPVVLAMACPHAFMNFLCIAGMAGADIAGGEESLLPRQVALEALDLLRELAADIPEAAYGWSSIGALDALAASDALAYCPMVFCFTTYARDARAGARLRYALPPLMRDGSAAGAIAGGTGLAVSAASQHRAEALEAVAYLASATSQIRCAIAGGQPARIEAWTDGVADHANGRFFSDCFTAMQGAVLRPRYAGYIALQNEAGDILREAAMNRALRAVEVIDRIDRIYRGTRNAARVYSR